MSISNDLAWFAWAFFPPTIILGLNATLLVVRNNNQKLDVVEKFVLHMVIGNGFIGYMVWGLLGLIALANLFLCPPEYQLRNMALLLLAAVPVGSVTLLPMLAMKWSNHRTRLQC